MSKSLNENKNAYCGECGAKLVNNEKFCSECGAKVNEKVVSKKNKSIGLKIFDVICYIIGGFLSLIFLLSFLSKPDISLFAALLWGVSFLPFIYYIIQKKCKFSSIKIILMRIFIPIIMFIVLIFAIIIFPSIDSDSNDNQENNTNINNNSNSDNKIAKEIDKSISATYKYKNTKVKEIDGKYDVNIYLKRSDASYDENVWMAIDGMSVINSVKHYHLEDIDKNVIKYNIYFYNKDSNEICKSIYENDNSSEIDKLTFTSSNNETFTITQKQIDEYHKQKEEEEKKKQQETINKYKNSCDTLKYKDVLRTPENYINKQAYWFGEVNQVIGNGVYKVSVNCEKNRYADNGYICSDDIYVIYSGSLNLIEDDLIKMWGTMNGTETYITVLGASKTIPKFNAKYVELK